MKPQANRNPPPNALTSILRNGAASMYGEAPGAPGGGTAALESFE